MHTFIAVGGRDVLAGQG